MEMEYCGTNRAADIAQDLETNTCQERRWPPTIPKLQTTKGALGDRESTAAESCSKAYIDKLPLFRCQWVSYLQGPSLSFPAKWTE